MAAWCRACGQPQSSQAGACAACGVDLAIGAPQESAIGLVYEVKGKMGLGKRQGICLSVEGDTLLLHFSPKDKEPTRLPASTPPTDLVPSAYSPATRLLYAADLDTKASWDREAIRRRAAELCGDVRVLRRVADEALQLGWQHIIEWVPLTASEKSWRSAHFAATTGNEELLRTSLVALPDSGYPARGELLLPHLGLLRHHPAAWHPVLTGMVSAGVSHAQELLGVAIGAWDAALEGASAFLADNRRSLWGTVREQLAAGAVISPSPSHDTAAWTAASLVSSPDRSQPINSALDHLVGLEPALLDDLIDQKRLTKDAALTSLKGALRTYLLARLDAAKLSDAEVRTVGHNGELARRLFLSRDKATLSGLPESPRVSHYQALLEVVEGGRPDPRRLDEATIEVLELPTQVLGQIKDGATSQLTPEVIADPSLWPMFSDLAINGRLLPNPSLPGDHPLNIWVGLHRLIGLIWEGNLPAAVEHGNLLTPHLKGVEEQEDEARNLTAFALFQLGHVDEALNLLEQAMQGVYTENLLVNASIVASYAQPEVGVRYLARLVEEAPNPELQRAGLDQAINVWQGTDLDFPPVLIPALRNVLSSPQPVAEYLRLGRVAVNVAPDIVPGLSNPGGELDGPYRLIQIRGRWKTEKNFFLSDLAEEYIKLYRSVGRPDWFDEDWKTWVSDIRESVFVDFGEAMGSATFIDKVNMEAPELFTAEDRFVMLPQAGAHLSFAFRKNDNSWLADAAFVKFFFKPIDEFQAARSSFDPQHAGFIADNLARCMILSAYNMYEIQRPQMADEYNGLNERARWDQQNRYAIRSQQDRLLREAIGDTIATLEAVAERARRLSGVEDKTITLIREYSNSVSDWRSECERLLRNL